MRLCLIWVIRRNTVLTIRKSFFGDDIETVCSPASLSFFNIDIAFCKEQLVESLG